MDSNTNQGHSIHSLDFCWFLILIFGTIKNNQELIMEIMTVDKNSEARNSSK